MISIKNLAKLNRKSKVSKMRSRELNKSWREQTRNWMRKSLLLKIMKRSWYKRTTRLFRQGGFLKIWTISSLSYYSISNMLRSLTGLSMTKKSSLRLKKQNFLPSKRPSPKRDQKWMVSSLSYSNPSKILRILKASYTNPRNMCRNLKEWSMR